MIHGVLWLNDKEVGHILNEERQFNFDKVDENDPSQNKFIEFAEKWTSCALPKDNKELYDRVKSNQMHDHKPTCKKKGTFCRFHFPKLTSKRTLVAKPIDPDMDELEKKEKMEKAKNVHF